MRLLKSDENGDAIEQLFLDAQKSIVIVSPYIGIKNWKDMKNILMEKSEKGIFIEVHSRKNRDRRKDITEAVVEEEFKDIKLKNIFLHMDLHAKIYFNEKNAIITSLNLKDSSLNNIETGYLIEDDDRKEFEKLLNDFYYPVLIKKNEEIMIQKRIFILYENIGRIVKDIKIDFNEDLIVFNSNYEIRVQAIEEPCITGEIDKECYLYFFITIFNDDYLRRNLNFETKTRDYSDVIPFSQENNTISVMFYFTLNEFYPLKTLLNYMLFTEINNALYHLIKALES